MRVMLIHNKYRERGGEDAVVDAQAELLRANGYQVCSMISSNSANGWKAAAQLASTTYNPLASRRVAGVLKDFAPDVAHIHNTWFALSPSVAWRLHRAAVPVVMTIHNYRLMCINALLYRDEAPCEDCVGTHSGHGVRHRCYRGSLVASVAAASAREIQSRLGIWERSVTFFLCVTEFARARMIDAGFSSSKLRVVRNFVAPADNESAEPWNSTTVLFVGRLAHEKGVLPLLAAWRRAAPEGLDLAVIGDGPQLQQARRAAEDLPGVRVLGKLPNAEARAKISEARALLMPSSWYEGQPVVALEAFAAGVPVLASRLGGLAETVDPLGEDWSVPESGIEAWASRLSRLVNDDLVMAGAARARHAYASRHTPEIAMSHLREIYAEATEGKRLPSITR